MKKNIFTLLALLVCAVGSAWADQTWDFTTMSSTDEAAYTADTGNWDWNSGGYFQNKFTTSNKTTYTSVISSTITQINGWKFARNNSGGLGAGAIRIYKHTSNAAGYFGYNNSGVFVKFTANAGDIITIACGSGESSASKKFTFTNATVSGSSSSDVSVTAGSTNTQATLTVTATGDVTFTNESSKLKVYSISVAAGGPTINTQPVSASYAKDAMATALSVTATASAGSLTYQWYSNTTESTEGATKIDGATSSTYTPSTAAAGTTYYYCAVTDGNGTVNTDIVSVTVASSAPTITTDLQEEYNVTKGSSIVLSIVAEGATSYQWYTVLNEAIEGATSSSYTVQALDEINSYQMFYCAAINAAGTTYSRNAKVTTVGRTGCELTNIKFSNGAYGAINSGTYGDKTIAVPYMAGTTAPTVNESSIVVSEGATHALDGNKLTVTAEDGTTNKVFTITKVAVTPLSVSADVATTNFTAVPSWVFNLYGYNNDSGVKFAKAVNDGTMRIALGNTRQYYFIGAAKSLTLTKKGTTRKVNVYVNGTKVISDKNNDALGAIALDELAPCMVMVESNQTSGDGGFASYAIAASTEVTIDITCEGGYASYSCDRALDFSTSTAKAYIIKATSENSATLTEVTKVPANTGIIVKGTKGESVNIAIATGDTDDVTGNLLKSTASGPVAVAANEAYGLSKTDGKFHLLNAGTIPANKAYLLASEVFQASQGAAVLDLDFGETTGINMVNGSEFMVNGSDFYNLNGQRVAQPTKGLYIVNGRKVIIK